MAIGKTAIYPKYHVGSQRQTFKSSTKALVNIDMLKLRVEVSNEVFNRMCTYEDIGLSEDIFLRNTYTKNSLSYELLYGGEYIGVLELTHHDRINKSEGGVHGLTLRVENDMLYKKDTLQNLKALFSEAGDALKYQRIRELHICYDTNENLLEYYRRYCKSKHLKLLRKLKIQNEENGIYLGSMKSDKYILTYNKSSRIERENKQYIRRYWEANGLNVGLPVYRFELRLLKHHVNEYNCDFYKLNDINYLAGLLKRELKDYCQFKYIGNAKFPKRGFPMLNEANIIELINLKNLTPIELNRVVLPKREKTRYAKNAVRLLTVMEALPQEVEQSKEDIKRLLIDRHNLHHWYAKYNRKW